MYCRRGHFSLARSLRARGSVMGHPIISSRRRSKWVCHIVLESPQKESSNDLMVAAARRQSVWKHAGLLPIGTRFRSIQHSSPNTNSVSALFDTKKFHLLQGEEKKKRRKRAGRPKFPMRTNFVCCSHRSSAGALSGP